MTKVCSKCKEEKPVEMFNKKKCGKDGLNSICKECVAEYSKQYYEQNKEQKKEYGKQNEERIKQYHAQNKEKIAEQEKQYYKQNKERLQEQKKQYREQNKERINEQKKQYYEQNKDQILECVKQYCKQYPEKIRIRNHRYRAMKRSLPATLTPQQWEKIKIHFDNKCCYCGNELPLTQDHFIALNKGGEYSHNNIIPACQSCNSSKNNKDFFIWYPKHRYYSKAREKKILDFLGYNKDKEQQLILMMG